ncbi:MAG: family oxidoreductase [Verrucomicrobiaceae bacterium]|nr:family oxidoreductase [Verrucomicrobiaceae bacterium]
MSSTLFSSLTSKTAIVTGASRGIGRATAIELARQGVHVMLAARSEGQLKVAVAEIEAAGGVAAFSVSDLRDPEAPARLVKETVAAFGGIDVVVNNAGATKRGDFLKLTEADWADGFALKFFGAVRLIRAAWPHLKEHSGSVVNIAGVGGRTPGAEFAIGGSVNAAMLSLTKALADAGIADGIQVNAINPGPVRTERLEVRLQALAEQKVIDLESAEAALQRQMEVARFGEPQDIADLVAFMVSSKGRFFHGSLVDIDGGQTKTI